MSPSPDDKMPHMPPEFWDSIIFRRCPECDGRLFGDRCDVHGAQPLQFPVFDSVAAGVGFPPNPEGQAK